MINFVLAYCRTKDGAATCTSAPIHDDEQFQYFEFLNNAQCFEHTEGGIALDARASLVSLSHEHYSIIIMTMSLYYSQKLTKEGEKIRIVEVERSNPSKLYRYTEQGNDYEEQLTFITFVSQEPDPSVFNVPIEICGQRNVMYHQLWHLYRY